MVAVAQSGFPSSKQFGCSGAIVGTRFGNKRHFTMAPATFTKRGSA